MSAENIAQESSIREKLPGVEVLLANKVSDPNSGGEHPGKKPIDKGWKKQAIDRYVKALATIAEARKARDAGNDVKAGALVAEVREAVAKRVREIDEHIASGGNVGLTIPPGSIALDTDDATSAAWLREHCPEAIFQRTSKGVHGMGNLPEGYDVSHFPQDSKIEIAAGIFVDLRLPGKGQIIIEPSIHKSGTRYLLEKEIGRQSLARAEIPVELLKLVKVGLAKKKKKTAERAEKAEPIDVDDQVEVGLTNFNVSKGRPCPVCGGGDDGARGPGGDRCGGYMSESSRLVYCTRTEYGDRGPNNGAYQHKLNDCPCDHKHKQEPEKKKRGPAKTYATHTDLRRNWQWYGATVGGVRHNFVESYKYTLKTGGDPQLLIGRFEDGEGGKTFRQGSVTPGGRWSAKKDPSVRPMLYCWPEVAQAIDAGEVVFLVEGEKDVEALRAVGAVATCVPGGAQGGRAALIALAGEFADAIVCIVPDKDAPGYQFAADAYPSIAIVAREVSIQQARTGNDSADSLAVHGLAEAFEPVTIEELAKLAGLQASDLKRVTVRTDLDESQQQALLIQAVLRRAEREHDLLRRRGNVVWVRDGRSERLDVADFRNVALDEACARKQRNGRLVPDNFKDTFLRATFKRLPERLAELVSISQTPVLRGDGRIVMAPGFDPDTGIQYSPKEGFEMDPLPPKLEQRHFDAAVAVYTHAFSDFQFATPEDRANAMASILTPLGRPAIDGPTPGFLIVSPVSGSGKSLLVSSASMIAIGETITSTGKSNEAELTKTLEAQVDEGNSIIFLDNVRKGSTLSSGTIAAMITSDRYTFRLLGGSKMSTCAMRSVFFVTGNNVSVSPELGRRFCRVRIDTELTDPAARDGKGYAVPELLEYLTENRAKFVYAGLVILRWALERIQEGFEPACDIRADMASFWRLIGSAVQLAGWGTINMTDLQSTMTDEGVRDEDEAFGDFLEAMLAQLGPQPFLMRRMATESEGGQYRDDLLQAGERDQMARGRWSQILGVHCRGRNGGFVTAASGTTLRIKTVDVKGNLALWQIEKQ